MQTQIKLRGCAVWIVAQLATCAVFSACSDDPASDRGAPAAPLGGAGTPGVAQQLAGTGGGGQLAGTGGSGGDAAGSPAGAGSAGVGASGSGGSVDAGAPPAAALNLVAIGANTTVGLEWDAVAGATAYHVYWSTSPGVDVQSAQQVTAGAANLVHRGLTNGTAYYYVVTAESAGVESAPSAEQTATPGGEWVLEELGSGIVDDVRDGAALPRIPIAERLHVLLFAEGYTSADLSTLHALASHDGARGNDVDRWVDLVFGIEPYAAFRQAFVVWYLPRPSNAHIPNADTAFAVPIDTSSSFPGVAQIAADGETAKRAWAALSVFPYPPASFDAPNSGTARNVIAAFMIFDPSRGRASVSGRALGLRNPAASSQRLAAALGVGHAHEFTHAFSALRDEYLEDTNMAPTTWSGTSNVVGTSSCEDVPWAHLLVGGAINPTQDELVGAFGRAQHGFHSELLCLLNGTHDNATYYGGNGTLRVENRMCNFCREITAFRVYQRAGLLSSATGFDTWKSEYRTPFYDTLPFFVPALVPQTNNVSNPAQGTPQFEACTATSMLSAASLQLNAEQSVDPSGTSGCFADDI